MLNQSREVCKILNTKFPIIQAPMNWLTDAQLVSAVSNHGGLGVIGPNSGQTIPTHDPKVAATRTKQIIQDTKKRTDHSFGLNIISSPNEVDKYTKELLKVAFEENIKYFVVVGDYNHDVFSAIKQHDGIIIYRPLTPTKANLKSAQEHGADILVVTGFDEGGILPARSVSTFTIFAEVMDVIKIPVLLAGGINTIKNAKAAVQLGADGLYMGTRFLMSVESPAAESMKHKVIEASADDLVFVSNNQRSIKNKTSLLLNKQYLSNEDIDTNAIISKIGSLRPAMLEGKIDEGIISTNTGIGSITDIKSVQNIIDEFSQVFN